MGRLFPRGEQLACGVAVQRDQLDLSGTLWSCVLGSCRHQADTGPEFL